ncbi:hypothetical protein M3Y99_00940300 [Aphelenchoides fujianensis]|nr:hypothetical protein M3Y99_00940300 [Aphelenchoides fujianensis]
MDVNSRAVRPIGALGLADGQIGGLHVHAGRLHVVERDAARITRIHALDPADGRVLRMVDVKDREETGVTRRDFSPAALAFHDHSAVFLEQLIVETEGREERVLQPRLGRLDLRSGEWTTVDSPIVTEIATSCWYSEWQEGVVHMGEPTDLLHADESGGITLHVRTSHSSANGEAFYTGKPTWTWRSYRLPG